MRMQNGNEKEFGESDVRRTNILSFTTYLILTLVTWPAIDVGTRGWDGIIRRMGGELNPIPSKV